MSESFAYSLPNTVLNGLVCTYTISLVSRHVYLLVQTPPQISNGSNDTSKYNNRKSPIFLATMLSLFMFTLNTFLTFVWRAGELAVIPISHWCHGYVIVVAMVYGVGKFSMFAVFLLRIQTAFKGSIYEYSNRLLKCLFILLVISMIVMLGLVPIFGQGKSTKMTGYGSSDKRKACSAHFNLLYVFCGGMMDLFWNGLTLWMFIHRLRQLFSDQTESDNSNGSDGGHTSSTIQTKSTMELQMSVLPLKYGILTGVAVMSSLLAFLILGLSRMAIVIALDTAINMTCLVLMTGVWKRSYWMVCSPLLSCMANDTSCLNHEYKLALNELIHHFQTETADHQQTNFQTVESLSPT